MKVIIYLVLILLLFVLVLVLKGKYKIIPLILLSYLAGYGIYVFCAI